MDYDAMFKEIEDCRNLVHPMRTMRVTLECGHLRLLPYNWTVMGIGAITGCLVCEDTPARRVMNVEETGQVWFESYRDRPQL